MWIEGRLDGSDGARAVAWAQTLPGARPDVGMYGVSYDASVQWETAALRPAGLRSIFPGGMMPDSRSVWPGVFRVGRQLKWDAHAGRGHAPPRRAPATPRPRRLGRAVALRGGQVDLERAAGIDPGRAAGRHGALLAGLVRSPREDWNGFGGIPARIPDVAIGLVTGWHDRCLDTVEFMTAALATPRTARHRAHRRAVEPRLRAATGRRRRRLRARGRGRPTSPGGGLVRPDARGRRGSDRAGGPAARAARSAVRDGRELLARRSTAGHCPRATDVCTSGPGRWRAPPGSLARSTSSTTRTIPSRRPTRPTTRTRRSTSGSSTGDRTSSGSSATPLAEPLEIIGAARLVLHASTDALDTDWHVKLLDVSPDGRAINVATGMLRARWRDGFDARGSSGPARSSNTRSAFARPRTDSWPGTGSGST